MDEDILMGCCEGAKWLALVSEKTEIHVHVDRHMHLFNAVYVEIKYPPGENFSPLIPLVKILSH